MSFQRRISGVPALTLLEQENHISHRDYLLISQFISKKDFSLESLKKVILNKTKKLEELRQDLLEIDQYDGVEIRVINRLMRLDVKTKKQKRLIRHHSIRQTLDRTNRFREVVSELISEEETDLANLIKIRDVYIDYLPEATLSPRSSRSELETSPTRKFNTSPTLSPRRSPSPRSSPRSSSPLRNSGQRLLAKSPIRNLRKSVSAK